MSTTRLWSLAGVAIAAVGLGVSGAPELIKPDPHDTYVGCLNKVYEGGGAEGGALIAKAYGACREYEGAYRTYLSAEGIADARLIKVVGRVNEVAFARHQGLGLEDTKGCFDAVRRQLPLS